MPKLSPYIMFNGTCEEAMNFYKACFDGEITYMGRFGESPMEVPEAHKDKIMHVTFSFWGASFMASDFMSEADYTTRPDGSNIHLSLQFDDLAKMDQTFKTLGADGAVTMALQNQFWGSRFGMLTDKFGIKWMFSGPTQK